MDIPTSVLFPHLVTVITQRFFRHYVLRPYSIRAIRVPKRPLHHPWHLQSHHECWPCLLTKTDSSSIRTFVKASDQYCHKVICRAKQLQAGADAADKRITMEASISMELKYCVEATHFSSCTALGFIIDATSFDSLTNAQLRSYLDKQAVKCKDTATLELLDKQVTKELVMHITNRNAKSRIQNLLMDYHSLLTKQGLKYIVSDNQKLAVSHVLYAICPVPLRTRLQSDLQFSNRDFKKDFNKFLSHTVKLSEALQIVDSGPRGHPKTERTDNRLENLGALPNTDAKSGTERELPLCLYEPCQKQDLRHLLKHCKVCPKNE